jgi:hypothetical protein
MGYSAYELAHAWQSAERFPPAVGHALEHAPFGAPELLFAVPEHKVSMPGRGGSSATDLFALARAVSGDLIAIAVEGKVRESFDKPVSEWLVDPRGNRPNRQQRLAGAETLGLRDRELNDLPYQLLHRSAAPIIEAGRYNAEHALMLVHSFSETMDHHVEYVAFAEAMGVTGMPGQVEFVGVRDGVQFYLCWIADQPRTQPHAGEPEAILLDALAWLRGTYAEHRFFKERDVEAALQQRMSELLDERRSHWCVVENYKTIDLAVVDRTTPDAVAVGVEIKYEPDHARPGEEARRKTGKHPVTDWPAISKDVNKIHSLVETGAVSVGYAILIDEGGHHRRSHPTPAFGVWQLWGTDTDRTMATAILTERVGQPRGS